MKLFSEWLEENHLVVFIDGVINVSLLDEAANAYATLWHIEKITKPYDRTDLFKRRQHEPISKEGK